VNGERVQQAGDPNGIDNGKEGVFVRTPKGSEPVLKTTWDDFEMRGKLEQP
jgi:hypothetical protein